MEIIKVKTKEEIKALGSAMTIEGLDETAFQNYVDWVREHAGIKNERVYLISGKVMNDAFGLTGTNRYKDELTIASIDLDDIECVDNIIMKRFEIGARWLDDIIDNNLWREGRL